MINLQRDVNITDLERFANSMTSPEAQLKTQLGEMNFV